jgi:hypothetical protein
MTIKTEKKLIFTFQLNFSIPQPLSRVRDIANTNALEGLKEKGIDPESAEILVTPANVARVPLFMLRILPSFILISSCIVEVYAKS